MEILKSLGGRTAAVGSAIGTLMVLGFVLAGPASATPADPVTDGFTEAGTKVAVYGGAMVALILVGLLIMLGVKYLRRGVRSA